MNNKNITPEDVLNLFESAGLSRSNPYNIVIQGQVQALAKMSPSERLELLKEVAGARVYDDKKKESLKILEETAPKLEKIEEILEMLNERLNALEKEKEELKIYQQFDRDRRALEYTIKEIELKETINKLNELDQNRSEEANKSSELFNQLVQLQNQIKTIEKELKSYNNDVLNKQKEREILLTEKSEYIKKLSTGEFYLEDIKDDKNQETNQRLKLENELKNLKKEIESCRKELEEVDPKYLKSVETEQKLNEKIMDNERRVHDLYSKQGRTSQFKTQKERDEWIVKEVASIKEVMKAKQAQIQSLKEDIKQIESDRTQQEDDLKMRNKHIEELTKEVEDINEKYNKIKKLRDEFADRRKELWRKESDLDAQILNCKNDISRAEGQLETSIPKDLSNGLNALKKIVEKKKLEKKVYGPLIDLFETEDDFITAIEVTAGLSLFHVVVDTDETASKILEELNREKSGRLTLMPLNKIKIREQTYPKTTTAQPITDILEFDHTRFEKAFQQVFGKTLLCSSLESGSSIAKTHNVSCVTLDGDQINNKGALTGGFYDKRFSKIRAMKELNKLRNKVKELEAESVEIKKNIQEVDQRITQIISELQTVETERTKTQHSFQLFMSRARESQAKLNTNKELLERRKISLNELETNLKQLNDSLKSLESEKGTKLLSKLSDDEQKELVTLNNELEKLHLQMNKATQERTSLEQKKRVLEDRLTNNLLLRQVEIENELMSMKFGEHDVAKLQQSSEVGRYRKYVSDIDEKIHLLDENISSLNSKIDEMNETLNKLNKKEKKLTSRLREETKEIEKMFNLRSTLYAKKEDILKRKREIGSLPLESTEKFKDLSYQECTRLLKETKQQLNKYPEVNKKALDQYISFAEERDKFLERKKKMDEERQSINDLMTTLDLQKDEAIERTFKGVSSYFEEVFHELTGGGKASLVMLRKDEESETGPRIRQYKGVDIKVSFTTGKMEQMNQLSGGQQSLVALSLIFAIQRCDPAPFYVFDEIDPALDDRHRLAVSRMIQKQSEDVQFIVTTHRPELINVADKCYRIMFENKVSNIVSVEKEEALSVVSTRQDDDDDNLIEEEELGEEEENEDDEPGRRKRKRE